MHRTYIRNQYFYYEDNCYFLNDDGVDKIINITNDSLQKLIKEEKSLFINKLSEETIKYRFSLNLNSSLYQDGIRNSCHTYFLDMNYNRIGDQLKFIEGRNRVLFDMIIHQRGKVNDYPENLIHYEFKGFDSILDEIESDRQRLIFTTAMSANSRIVKFGYEYNNSNNRYNVCGYQLGFLIIMLNNSIQIEVYRDSQLYRETNITI